MRDAVPCGSPYGDEADRFGQCCDRRGCREVFDAHYATLVAKEKSQLTPAPFSVPDGSQTEVSGS